MLTMRYARRLSPAFRDLLLPSGPLNFLVRDFSHWIAEDQFALDVQLREGDKLMFYHGTTALLTVTHHANRGEVTLSAASAYENVPGHRDLMRRWQPSEFISLQDRVPTYLRSAVSAAGDQYYRNGREGYWQNRLALRFGLDWKPGSDWLILDREAVVGFGSSADKAALLTPIQRKYQTVREQLQQENPRLWGVVDGKGFGDEADFLAIGPDHRLYVIELKHGANVSGIAWGRLQAAVYRGVFAQALDQIASDIQELAQQKVELGLLPAAALQGISWAGLNRVVPVLMVAEPNADSNCWARLNEVLLRCPEADASVVQLTEPID